VDRQHRSICVVCVAYAEVRRRFHSHAILIFIGVLSYFDEKQNSNEYEVSVKEV